MRAFPRCAVSGVLFVFGGFVGVWRLVLGVWCLVFVVVTAPMDPFLSVKGQGGFVTARNLGGN